MGVRVAYAVPLLTYSAARAGLRTFLVSATDPAATYTTISAVNAAGFLPGDSVLFKGGETFSGSLSIPSSGNSSKQITFGSYGAGRATISSGTAKGCYALNRSFVDVKDLIFVGAGGATNATHGVHFENNQAGNTKLLGVRLINLDVSGFGYHGVFFQGTNGTSGFDGPQLTGLNVHGCTGSSSVGTSGAAGIHLKSAPAYLSGTYAHVNAIIEDCAVYSNTGSSITGNWTGAGIVPADIADSIVRRCTIYDNGSLSQCSSGGPCGVMPFNALRVTVQDCTSYSNRGTVSRTGNGDGFDLDIGCKDCVIERCLAYDNDGAGFLVYNGNPDGVLQAGTGNAIRNCYSITNNVGGQAAGEISIVSLDSRASSVDVYHNTAYSTSVYGTFYCLRYSGAGQINTKVANNIFANTHATGMGVYDDVDTGVTNAAGVTLRGNCYAVKGRIAYWGGNIYRSLDGFLAVETTQERVSTAVVAVSSDPKFVSPGTLTAEAHQLSNGSPIADAGIDLSAVLSITPPSTDYFGTTRPVGSGPSMGAHDIAAQSTASEAEFNASYTVSSTSGSYGNPVASPTLMRDSTFGDASSWGSSAAGSSASPQYIIADVGSVQTLTKVNFAPRTGSVNVLRGAAVEISSDGTNWTWCGKLYGVASATLVSFPLGSRNGRYIRLKKDWDTYNATQESNSIALSEFRPYGYGSAQSINLVGVSATASVGSLAPGEGLLVYSKSFASDTTGWTQAAYPGDNYSATTVISGFVGGAVRINPPSGADSPRLLRQMTELTPGRPYTVNVVYQNRTTAPLRVRVSGDISTQTFLKSTQYNWKQDSGAASGTVSVTFNAGNTVYIHLALSTLGGSGERVDIVSMNVVTASAGAPLQTDRRVILQEFTAEYTQRNFTLNGSGQQKNPRGFWPSLVNDVWDTTAFRAVAVARAHQIGKAAKANDARGVIIWDICGQEFGHTTTYTGNPDEIATFAPEMDAIADDFVAVLRDTYGLQTGVCLRPQFIPHGNTLPDVNDSQYWFNYPFVKLTNTPPHRMFTKYFDSTFPLDWYDWYNGNPDTGPAQAGVQTSADDAATQQRLIDRIQYCKTRWSMSLFYIDTTVYPDGTSIPASIWHAVHVAHPDVLLAPENEIGTYYDDTTPYGEVDGGTVGPGDPAQDKRDALQVVSFADLSQEIWDFGAKNWLRDQWVANRVIPLAAWSDTPQLARIAETASGPEINATYSVTGGTYSTYSGHTGTGVGLRDGAASTAASVWAASTSAGGSITAILSSSTYVERMTLLPIPFSFAGWGANYLEGALIEYSNNGGASWTTVGNALNMADNAAASIAIKATVNRIRVTKTDGFWLAVGDFRLWGPYVAP